MEVKISQRRLAMVRDRINEWAAEFGMNVIVKYKFIFLAAIALLIVGSGLGMRRLVTDTSNESFLSEGDEMIVQNNRFKEIFGNEEFVFVFVEADDVFSSDTLQYVQALSEDFDRNLPFAVGLGLSMPYHSLVFRGESAFLVGKRFEPENLSAGPF
jgi:hypothetical protein